MQSVSHMDHMHVNNTSKYHNERSGCLFIYVMLVKNAYVDVQAKRKLQKTIILYFHIKDIKGMLN